MLRPFLLLLVVAAQVSATPGCVPRTYDSPTRLVCVCSGTKCDDIESLGTIEDGTAVIYRTEKATGKRMDRSVMQVSKTAKNKVMRLDTSELFQEVIGFGGAFTDSAGINIAALPTKTQELLLKQYYGPNGAEYTIGRIPMASTDFSTREYSYCDKSGDFNLTTFGLAEEDTKYKIPYILRAMELQKNTGGLKFFASPWSAPGWMKTNNRMKGGGQLKGFEGGRYYVTWANYFVKFLEAYASAGIPMWGLTVQNEPNTGADPNYRWQTMYFSAEMERNFIRDQLGPALQASKVGKDVGIIIMDDQREFMPWADIIYADEYVSSLSPGIGVHWYDDLKFPPDFLSDAHNKHPGKFILATEACEGSAGDDKVIMGDFGRGESYAHSILVDMNNFAGGWTDWNIALDPQGGPNWVQNFVDSPIIVNATAGEFLKQPMYYAMMHFSKFIKPGSHRAALKVPAGLPGDVTALGLLLKDKKRAVVVLNRNETETASFSIEDAAFPGLFLNIDMPPHSIITAIWNG